MKASPVSGRIVLPGLQPVVADVAINFEDAVARTGGRVRDVGDLAGVVAVDTLDATGVFLHPRPEALTSNGPRGYLTVGSRAALDIRAGADTTSALTMQNLCFCRSRRRMKTYPVTSRRNEIALSVALRAGRSVTLIQSAR